ncbi:MAG: hypothetical protein IPK82_02870 [Polyangiaceae bacterium]|nr:hypothetical protein [Polyangiaceae bacterium]
MNHKRAAKKPKRQGSTARAAAAVGAIAASFSFAGCPCLESVVNPSPALQWWLFSNFGASRMCPEMLKQGLSLRLQERQPAIGRFFPSQCSYAVDDNRRTVAVSFSGTGYGYTTATKRVGFSVSGTIELRPGIQLAGDKAYVFGHFNRIIMGPTFQVGYIENPVVDIAANLPGIGSMANLFGNQVVAGELTRGFTVVNTDKGNDFALGILMPPQMPHHPYDTSASERYTFANETVEVHQNQRDYLGPFEVPEAGKSLYLALSNQGPALDIMVVNRFTGDAWRDQYQRGMLAAAPGPIVAGGPLNANMSETRRYALPPGSYYVVVDNTAAAGLVNPPASLLPLGDAMARVSYVAQLGE